MYGIDADIVLSIKQGVDLGHDPVGGFGGVISGKIRSADDAVDRGYVDDISRFLLLHVGHNILGAEEGTGDVDIEDPFPFNTSILVSGLVGTCHACVVNQDIDFAVFFVNGFDHFLNPLLVRHIERVIFGLASSTGDSLYDFLSIFLASACDYGHSTFSGQYPGYGLAYSVGRSCDDRHFTFYSSHCRTAPFNIIIILTIYLVYISIPWP